MAGSLKECRHGLDGSVGLGAAPGVYEHDEQHTCEQHEPTDDAESELGKKRSAEEEEQPTGAEDRCMGELVVAQTAMDHEIVP